MRRLSLVHFSSRALHTTAVRTKNPYYYYDLSLKQPMHTFDPNHTFYQADSAEERVKKVFGQLGSREESRLEAQSKSRKIAGIRVPPRPEEPTNCCMSGCVNCVWEMYKDDLEDWRSRRNQAKSRLLMADHSSEPWPVDFGAEPAARRAGEATDTMVDDGADDAWSGVDVNIRVFVETEQRLHKQRMARAKADKAPKPKVHASSTAPAQAQSQA